MRIVAWPVGLAILLIATYIGVEQAILARIRYDLKRMHDDDYAIIRLHMGGEPMAMPSLLRMLKLFLAYEYSGDYEPQGSGGFTGKKNYLLMMVSNNKVVYNYKWSFRLFRLDRDDPAPWDIIANLPEGTRTLYAFSTSERFRRRGLWFCGEHFNNPSTTFYYRTIEKQTEHDHGHIE